MRDANANPAAGYPIVRKWGDHTLGTFLQYLPQHSSHDVRNTTELSIVYHSF